MKYLLIFFTKFLIQSACVAQFSLGINGSSGISLSKYRAINLTPFHHVGTPYYGVHFKVGFEKGLTTYLLGVGVETYGVGFKFKNDPSFRDKDDIPKVSFCIPANTISIGLAARLYKRGNLDCNLYIGAKLLTTPNGFNAHTAKTPATSEFMIDDVKHVLSYVIYNNSNRTFAIPFESKLHFIYKLNEHFAVLLSPGISYNFRDITSYIFQYNYSPIDDPGTVTTGSAIVSYDASVVNIEFGIRYNLSH